MTIQLIEHDLQQRELALDKSKSFIVQAPAGSGKTELLIQRFLTLLHCVKAPEEVLAITFTKKAANEMRARVIKALKQAQSEAEPEASHAKRSWQLARKVLQRDQQLHWNLLQNPNQLRIQTIDSLCAFLTKQLPLLSHFGSQPDISDTPMLLYSEAAQEVLSHVETNYDWSQAIATLLLHLDNDLNKLHDLLVNLLAKRDQWLQYIHLDPHNPEIREHLEQYLTSVVCEQLTSVKSLFPTTLATEALAIARFASDNLSVTKPDSPIMICRELTVLPGTTPSELPAWLGIAKLLLTDEGTWRKAVNVTIGFPAATSVKNPLEKSTYTDFKQRALALISALQDQEPLREALSALSSLPRSHYHDSQWEALSALMQVLRIAAAQLRVTFQQHGQIDFIENAQAAILALGNEEHPTDLALALDYQIQHILIDEFQDTSFTQYQLLKKLITGWDMNDGRTLFVVGDPMQSIYRFREAEVGLFIRMRNHGIGNIKLIPLTLSVSFRSTPTIVQWNNTHFSGIFPPFNDMATGAVSFSPSISKQQETPDLQSRIEVVGLLNGTPEVQADYVVPLIESLLAAAPNEKIAILVRARQHLSALIPALKKANIPYRAVDIDPLSERQSIQDLLSLTQALLHPANRIAWLAVLRAPWCGLSLADLLVIAGDNPYAAIYDQLQRPDLLMRLSVEGQAHLARFFPIIRSKLAERDRTPIRYWIESTWIALGGPACLNDYSEMEDINAFFKLLEEISQHNEPLNLQKLMSKMNSLFATAQNTEAALQLMTIHSAKGLEFDTVILPHLERKSAMDDSPLLAWMERPLPNDEVALLLAPIHATGDDKDPIYDYIRRQQKIKSDYEMDRLLYVATTRAKKQLYLFFNISSREQGGYKTEPGSLLNKLWPFFEKQAEEIIITDHLIPNAIEPQTTLPHLTRRLISSWVNPIRHMPTVKIATHLSEEGFMLIDNRPRLIGTVVHRLLQKIAELKTAWWVGQKSTQQKNYLQCQLLQAGILPKDIESAQEETFKIIQTALSDQRGQWILAEHQDAQAEFSLTALIENELENLVIDRTFVDEQDVRWIVDYKTATLNNMSVDMFLTKELEKYLEKMHKYGKAMKLHDKGRKVKLGLYFPAVPAWQEWELA